MSNRFLSAATGLFETFLSPFSNPPYGLDPSWVGSPDYEAVLAAYTVLEQASALFEPATPAVEAPSCASCLIGDCDTCPLAGEDCPASDCDNESGCDEECALRDDYSACLAAIGHNLCPHDCIECAVFGAPTPA